MVLFLIGDVRTNRINVIMTYTEGRVPGLPCELVLSRKLLMNPSRRVRLYIPHDVRQRSLCGEGCKDVNMICNTVDEQGMGIKPRNIPPMYAKSLGLISGVMKG